MYAFVYVHVCGHVCEYELHMHVCMHAWFILSAVVGMPLSNFRVPHHGGDSTAYPSTRTTQIRCLQNRNIEISVSPRPARAPTSGAAGANMPGMSSCLCQILGFVGGTARQRHLPAQGRSLLSLPVFFFRVWNLPALDTRPLEPFAESGYDDYGQTRR